MVKKIVGSVILTGIACAVFATDARVETMGNSDHFFQDEISIHRNAANMGFYDKIMFGSYGAITRETDWTEGVDWRPSTPHFGGVISFGQKEGSLSKFTVGATFNRVDSALNYVAYSIDELGLRTADRKLLMNNKKETYDGRVLAFAGNSVNIGAGSSSVGGTNLDLLGKVDLMAAKTLENGTTIGMGLYFTFQDGARRELIAGMENKDASSGDELKNRFVKGNVGVNTPIGDGVDLEASVAISTLTLRGSVLKDDNSGKQFYSVADNDVGIQIDVRMFADIASINGAFVPHIQANIFNYDCGEEKIVDFNAGLGLNVNIDRGFFWTGFEGIYNKKSNVLTHVNGQVYNGRNSISTDYNGIRNEQYDKKDVIGGKVGFGIERNVLTDWFVIRVGGSKLFAKESVGKNSYKWVETDDKDHVSLGMGVNIEDRLKIDFTIAQNLPYTFTGLFSSGGNPYLASRVSAVFAF